MKKMILSILIILFSSINLYSIDPNKSVNPDSNKSVNAEQDAKFKQEIAIIEKKNPKYNYNDLSDREKEAIKSIICFSLEMEKDGLKILNTMKEEELIEFSKNYAKSMTLATRNKKVAFYVAAGDEELAEEIVAQSIDPNISQEELNLMEVMIEDEIFAQLESIIQQNKEN